MALTKTVNYTQTIPVSLNFSNEVSGTTGVVRAEINYNKFAGRLNTPSGSGGVSGLIGCGALSITDMSMWFCEGTEAQVNDMLNQLKWIPATYADGNIQQDFMSADIQVSEEKGELYVLCNMNGTDPVVSVGDYLWVDTGGANDYKCLVVDIISYVGGHKAYYLMPDASLYDSPTVPNLSSYGSVLRDADGGTKVGDIIERGYTHPHGQYEISITITDDGSLHANGIVTLDGEWFVRAPIVGGTPVPVISGLAANTCSDLLSFGGTGHPDDELIAVQLLIKKHWNDPTFAGNVDEDRPDYVTDDSYGTFSKTTIGSNISTSSGIVRWHFFGRGVECNAALSNIIFKAPNDPKSCFIELRIMNGRHRIFRDRGYD
jgi:hypothetical protein